MGRRRFAIAGLVVLLLLVIAGAGGLLYYRSLRDTPQYSLALIVDAAKRGDDAAIAELIDVDAVVDDFVPQVTGKAVELYGRGLPPAILGQMAKIATPVLPAVKDRARAEIPRVIRERTERFGNVPFAAMVLGADRYLAITVKGDQAIVKSKLPEHPLELRMKRVGERWKIVAVRDEDLATQIAQKIGQEIVAIAVGGGVRKTADSLGVKGLTDILRQAEEILK
ncbi:MAG: hypothetical protein KA746_17475 [Pyrinomonadaceae bacterium]|nr:hypothetical protein [Pyrinomonadaceae bacterium]MBP6212019.1 hypothetical protein [Pyrinomonadaceae bacterium]